MSDCENSYLDLPLGTIPSEHSAVFPAPALTSEQAWAQMLSKVGRRLCHLNHFVDSQDLPSERTPISITVASQLEKERARLGRELHSGAGQPLSAIKLNLEILRESAVSLPANAQQALTRLENLADEAFQQMRAVSHRLHPPVWQSMSTASAIRSLIANSGLQDSFAVDIQVPELTQEPSHSIKIALYRCAQECLANIARHSGASSAQIRLWETPSRVMLDISDNGCGLKLRAQGSGIGLITMREYAAVLGGNCKILSCQPGTQISISIPFGEDE